MSVPHAPKLLILVATILAPLAACAADYSYKETSQITGGSMVSMMKLAGAFSSQARKAGEPIVSSVYLKGNRLARVSSDRVEIIDLDKENVTQIDMARRTYMVMTFAQMREQMAKAAEQAQQQQDKIQKQEKAQGSNDVKMSFEVKVRNTGTQKQVSGLDTNEAILNMTMKATDQKSQQSGNMAVTNDMWMASDIPGYGQLRDFYVRMGQKMGGMTAGVGFDMSKILAANPGATQALADMGTEMQKLKGVPVMQVMRMGMTANGIPLPAASEAPLPPDNTPAMPSGSDIAKQSAASAITSKLGSLSGIGGLGGFGRKKKDVSAETNQNSNAAAQAATPGAAILMEMSIADSDFSSAPVDESHFAIPAGFKEVQPPTH